MANYANLPAPTPDGGLNRYMQDIRKFSYAGAGRGVYAGQGVGRAARQWRGA